MNATAATGALGRGRRQVASSCVLSASLGTIHAYSLFIDPLEQRLGASRADISLVYAVALVALTAGVLVSGERALGSRRRRSTPFVIAVMAMVGLFIAAWANSLGQLVVGYGAVFGFSNGLGYSHALVSASDESPGNRGFALGIVTAFYAFGAAVGAVGLDRIIWHVEATAALAWLGVLIVGAGLAAAALQPRSPVVPPTPDEPKVNLGEKQTGLIFLLWSAYGLSVVAGLMAIAHAAEIIESSTAGGVRYRVVGTVAVALGNGVGGLAAAFTADRVDSRRFLMWLPTMSAASLFMLAVSSDLILTIALLTIVGGIYGAIIAVYPFFVTQRFGAGGYQRAYGRIFTAWGVGGLAGPLLGGRIYDVSGGYSLAMTVAGAAAMGAVAVMSRVPVFHAARHEQRV